MAASYVLPVRHTRVLPAASFGFSAIGRMSLWLTSHDGHPCRPANDSPYKGS